jgi:hypothetical protein
MVKSMKRVITLAMKNKYQESALCLEIENFVHKVLILICILISR